VSKTSSIAALLGLSLSLLAGCRTEVPKDAPKADGEAASAKDADNKGGDTRKDGEPRKGDPDENRTPDVPFVVTPDEVVEKMLEVADLTDKDVVYDLGCGDGRIAIAAAKKYKCKAIGYDIDPDRIKDSEANKAKEPTEVQKLVTFVKADALKLDLSGASVIMVYMSEDFLEMLTPALKKLKAGSRIVSHNRRIPGADADQGFPIEMVKKNGFGTYVYRYTTPLKVD